MKKKTQLANIFCNRRNLHTNDQYNTTHISYNIHLDTCDIL